MVPTQVVHGLSIPLGKLGFFLPRTLSRAFNSHSNEEPESFQISGHIRTSTSGILRERRKRQSGIPSGTSTPASTTGGGPHPTGAGTLFRIGGSIIRDDNRPGPGTATPVEAEGAASPVREGSASGLGIVNNRTIRFPDETAATEGREMRSPDSKHS